MGHLKYVKGVVPTPLGLIAVSLECNGDRYRGTIFIPEGSSAMICLPKTADTVSFLLNDRECGEYPEFRKTMEKDYICIEVNIPGKYVFATGAN